MGRARPRPCPWAAHTPAVTAVVSALGQSYQLDLYSDPFFPAHFLPLPGPPASVPTLKSVLCPQPEGTCEHLHQMPRLPPTPNLPVAPSHSSKGLPLAHKAPPGLPSLPACLSSLTCCSPQPLSLPSALPPGRARSASGRLPWCFLPPGALPPGTHAAPSPDPQVPA